MDINLKELSSFLVKAKTKTYAAVDSQEISSQRPGFKELEFLEEDWNYRDSYAGFFMAPGQEIVYFKNNPTWAMAYSGGMIPEFHGDLDFAKQTFNFLKKALSKVEESRPFRGPENLKEGDWEYVDSTKGDITDFIGTERILYKGKEVFKQNYIGGLIISK